MSLLRFAFSGTLRNRRRTVSSILGVLLAITFIAGTFIAIDSSARATLDATLNSIQGDYTYYAMPLSPSTSNPAVRNGTALRDALASVTGIANVSVYKQIGAFMGGVGVYNPSSTYNSSFYVGTIMAVDPAYLPYSFRDATIAGSTNFPNNTLTLDSQLATNLQATVGDPVVLTYQTWNGTGPSWTNLSMTVSAIVTFPTPSYGYYYGPYPYNPTSLMINLRDADWLMSRLNLSAASNPQVQGEIWIDRNRFINPYDIPATTFQLTRLGRTLDAAILQAGYSGQSNDNITPALGNFANALLFQRVEYLLLSFPVVLLGLYLGAVGVDLGHAERRRELGVLKTRGASPRQVAFLLILESLLGGAVATVLGLLFGLALSRFLIGVVTPFGTAADYTAISLSADTVILVAILSTIFMAIVSYRSARRTARLPIIETLRYYAPGETNIHYSPALDIVMVAYSALVYGMYFYVTSNSGNLFILLIGSLLLITLPITPILLIIGTTRLLTRSTGRVYEATARLLRPFARNLEYVVSRNLSRNPRRSSNITIIIALGLAFGIFIVTALGSQQATQAQQLRASVGADVSAAVPYTGVVNVSAGAAGFAANLTTVPGIAEISHILPLSASISPSPSFQGASAFAIDPSTYFAVSQPASFYFEDPGSMTAAQQVLATNGDVLITHNYANDAALQIGDTMTLSLSTYINATPQFYSVLVHVGGIVRYLPGTGSSYYGLGTAPDAVYGSFTTLKPIVAAQDATGGFYGGNRFLASLAPGAAWKTVKADIMALGSTDVVVYQEQLDLTTNNAFTSSFLGFIRMEIAFIVVILTAGLGLIIYAASLERTVEFAGITARGSSGWQTAGLLVGEAVAIIIIGVIIGFTVGLLTGYLSVSFTTPSYGGGESIVPSLFVFPLEGLILLILAPVAMIGTTVLVAWRIARMNVARVLKMRGG